MRSSRRRFLRNALGASAAALSGGALEALFARARGDAVGDSAAAGAMPARLEAWQARGYGPLVPDPAGILEMRHLIDDHITILRQHLPQALDPCACRILRLLAEPDHEN